MDGLKASIFKVLLDVRLRFFVDGMTSSFDCPLFEHFWPVWTDLEKNED